MLFTAINRQNVLFVLSARLPRSDGRSDEWLGSMLVAANMATTKWVRIQSNMSIGAYEVEPAPGKLADPDWPDMPFQEILHIAFKERFIQDAQHPVLKRLRGEL
jgi:hypothetical protein